MPTAGPQRSGARAGFSAAQWAHPCAWIFAAALIVRVLYVLSIHHAYFFSHPRTEALRYDQWATLILQSPKPPAPPFEQSPGYPYFVAAVYRMFGHSSSTVALLQAALDAATCVMIAAAGCYWFGTRVGLIAGVLAAAYGPLIYFAGELLPATLFVFATMLAFSAAQRSGWSLSGCLWGLALVVRSEVVFALPFVLLDAWRRGHHRGLLGTLLPVALVFAVFLGLNAAHSSKLVLLTTSGGENLFLGNNPYADGVNPFLFGPLESIAQRVQARAADSAEWDQMLRGYALAFWKDHPAQAAQLLWKKFLWTWTDRELPNTSDIDWQTAHSWVFWSPLSPLSFGMILPFAAAGALLLVGEWHERTLLLAPIAVGLGSAVIFFTNARFRLIMVPSLLVLAAVTLGRFPSIVRGWRHSRPALVLIAIGVGVGAAAAWGNFYGVRNYQIPQIEVNTGVLEREAGNLDAAIRHLRIGLAASPRDSIGWVQLALALEQKGDAVAALQTYLDAIALIPDDRQLQQMAGRFWQMHRLDPAILRDYESADNEVARHRANHEALEALRHTTEREN
jgi:4-amino-4-deoxy-L-arabinose transferase-like glycosyltransferase